MSRGDFRLALALYDASVRHARSGNFPASLRFARMAGGLLGVDFAAPVSLALGGVR